MVEAQTQSSGGEVLAPAEVPELLPARMLNEFVYCPRLFYLEWVDARWADSADTEAGRLVHRRVDRTEGALPDPDQEDLQRRVTSVRLESTQLGLVAVIDRVDGDFGAVVPVEFKKGHPDPDGQPWPADRMQVLVHAALLREAGFAVHLAVVYYAETHQRIELTVTDGDIAEVVETVAQAREVAAAPNPPLPLVQSSRCPRCSLVGLCLPDETNALLARDAQPPRRILPRDPDSAPMYVTEQGAYVGVSRGRLRVAKDGDELAAARLIDVLQLCVYGNVQVSAQALSELWSRGIPVLWFSYGGWFRGWAQGEMSKYVELRRRQTIVHGQGGLDVARKMIAGKIRNSRVLLRRNSKSNPADALAQLASLAKAAELAPNPATLLGVEGAAARSYFQAFSSMLTNVELSLTFDAVGRRRRPAPDPVNALLGYLYSLLLKEIVAACIGVGLDPYLGVFHRPRYGRPALALDLMEEFRPLIADSVAIGMVNNGEVTAGTFSAKGNAVWLTASGRRAALRAFERRMAVQITHPVFGYKISYRRVIDVQARIFAAVVLGELPEYTPMVTR